MREHTRAYSGLIAVALYIYSLSALSRASEFVALAAGAFYLQVTGGEWSAFWEFAQRYGLVIAFLTFALITGARGWWYYGKAVDTRIAEIKEAYEQRLKDKDDQISAWRSASEVDARNASESLELARQSKDALARIERALARRKQDT